MTVLESFFKDLSTKEVVNMKAKLGSGKRFKALTNKLEKKGKSAESAKKIAAAVGRKKYGNAKMQKMASAGKAKK